MVGNNENILVEFDYNNIIVVDPNKVIDENGNAKERLVKQEDLVMYANLECKLIPRTKLALGVAANDKIQTVSIASINFMKPNGKQFLENDWVDDLTGRNTLNGNGVNQSTYKTVTNPNNSEDYFLRQTIKNNGKEGSVDTGLLGITSIDINQNTSFMPVITIKLTDVKGRALFELGDNSPYAAFFNLPYPLFYLTVKGYYGKAIRLPLMLQNFSSSFDSSTQNFDITLKFYTYKYSVLSELNMGELLATPHMFPSTISISPKEGGPTQFANSKNSVVERGYQKIKEVYSEYKSKGLIPQDFPELTILEMRNNLDNFINNVLDGFTKENLEPLNRLDEYQDTLNQYRKEVFTYTNGSWFSDFMDADNFYVLKNNGGYIYTFKDNNPKKTITAKNKLKVDYIEKYNNKLNSNLTCGKNGKYTINGSTYPSSINCDVRLEQFILDDITEDDIDFEETFLRRNNSKESPTLSEIESIKAKFKITNTLTSIDLKSKNGKPNKIDWFRFEGGGTGVLPDGKISNVQNLILKPTTSFIDYTSEIGKQLSRIREEIENRLTESLSKILESKNNGIGFVPSLRNVLSVIFASGEAFLRLMDDVHTTAWGLNSNKDASRYRKMAVLNPNTSDVSTDNLTSGYEEDTPIYPWPQVIVSKLGQDGQEKYELEYPGNLKLQEQYKSYLFEYWPEVEFVEELIKSLTKRGDTKKSEPVKNESLDITKISLNPIEFPVNNDLYSNKEEVKYFFEIYERLSLYSDYTRLSRVTTSTKETDEISQLISEAESTNIKNSLSNDNPFLIKKLKEYRFSSSNYLEILKHFSNDGLGESWLNFSRGIFNTPYIKNTTNNSQFSFINSILLSSSISSPSVSLLKEAEFVKYISESTTSNEFDFSDIYPIVDKNWTKTYLSDSNSFNNTKDVFNTTKVLNYDVNKKTLTNFKSVDDKTKNRPITNFNWIGNSLPDMTSIDYPVLKSFYIDRKIEDQLPTEGDLIYDNYDNGLYFYQTTSIFNTPYFTNSIQEGVNKFRSYEKYPFVSSAYYFINSLPLITLREKYKSYTSNGDNVEPNVEDLDYMISTLKKFGAIHKLPYAWILKIGSIWHRYKTYVETGEDILTNSWSGFSYVDNYDPETTNPEKVYSLTINNSQIDIVLQDNTIIGGQEFTLMNVGFYPKLINDFNLFYQGYNIYSGYTDLDIQQGFLSGVSLNYVDNAIIDLPRSGTTSVGFDPNSPTRNLRIIPWSVMVDTLDKKYSYVIPSAGSLINQTRNECFDINKIPNQLKTEVLNNSSIYDGSVRSFWGSPNYGYFDNSRVTKPNPTEYLKTILNDQKIQGNFNIRGVNDGGYTSISEIFSAFEKDVLDKFEQEFLNFSKSVYDANDNINVNTSDVINNIMDSVNLDESTRKMMNFQSLMRDMMKITKVAGNTGYDIVSNTQVLQGSTIVSIIKRFLNFDVVFKYGNPTNYDKRLFYSFSNFEIDDPYTWEKYSVVTPNSLPGSGNTITFTQSYTNYPEEWKTLLTYVGFSEIESLKYKNSGSYITDFFIDNNIAFTTNNIKVFSPIIKIYATQKLSNVTLDSVKFSELMDLYIQKNDRFLGKVINNVFINLRKNLPDVSSSTKISRFSDLKGDQTKYEIYDSLKALNDKWISGADFKNKTLFEDVLLVDRASRNIGDKILVDIYKLKNRLTNINAETSMLTFIQSIIVENHFLVMNIPSYVNFYNVQDVVKNPIPKVEGTTEFANNLFGTFMSVDYRDSSSKMVCFYAGRPSEHLDIKRNVDFRYRNDSFDLRKMNNPLVENVTNKTDHALSNRVVGFNVDIGPQNQQIFNGFSVKQNPGKATSESFQILNEMANLRGNRASSTQSTSLYNLYKSRSYSCSVTMMGNALIQPTMYFNLRYVPMFNGPYMILEVSHNIRPGSFTTTFTGVRQSAVPLPDINDYLQTLKVNLLKSITENTSQKKNQTSESKAKSSNVISQKDNVVKDSKNKSPNTLSPNQSCKPNTIYSTYVVKNPISSSYTTKEMITKINQLLSNIDSEISLKLKMVIFSSIYVSSYDGSKFKSFGYNFSGIKLIDDWKTLGDTYFVKQYFCSSDDKSMAIFDSLDKQIMFLRDKWSPLIKYGVKNINSKDITKFLILYSDFLPLSDNVYTTLSKNDLLNYETKVGESIDLYYAGKIGISD